jgi:hypothetical protein
MGKPDPKPIERHPRGPILPRGWHAMHNFGIPYRPRDTPKQEDWGTVARKFGVGVKELIYFNFLTTDPDEVNWYLHHHTGCVKASPSGNNWMFSNQANPGIIYIPPADDEDIDFTPEETCVWMPADIQAFMHRLFAISQGMSGNKGQRIKKLVQLIMAAGESGRQSLWYYNTMVITAYVDLKTPTPKRREMTKETNQAFPFDGLSGVYGQAGTEEQHRGRWRIHPVNDLMNEFACGHWDPTAMKDRLEEIDEDMYQGWYQKSLASARTGMGGGDAIDQLVVDFLHHMDLLSEDDTHLYSAFGQ